MRRASAIILAGGKGTRMGMLCWSRPKPVLPFAGIFKVIDFSLSNCINSGVVSIDVLVDHMRGYVRRYLRESRFAGRCRDGLRVIEPRSTPYLGTADAVFQNLETISQRQADAVLVLAGDHLYRMDYRRMVDYHERTGADVTVGVTPVPAWETHRFGVVKTDDAGRITEFHEKPKEPISTLASMGIYVFKPDVLARRLSEDAARPGSPHDFGHAILPGMVHRDRVFAFQFDGYWRDIGTVEAYYASNIDSTNETLASLFDGDWMLAGDQHTGLYNATPPASIRNSRIGEGCVIEGIVENSVISPGVRIERHAVVKSSIIMSGAVVGRHSLVNRAIVDEAVVIGSYCRVGFSAGSPKDASPITMLGNESVVPDFANLGLGETLAPYACAIGPKPASPRNDAVTAPQPA